MSVDIEMGARKIAPTFKQLEALWYRRIKDQGFDDAEDTSRCERPLKAWHSMRFKKDEAKETYYEIARGLLHTYQFKSPLERRIWELHAEGWSRREIALSLKIKRPANISDLVRRITKEIGLKI